MRKQPKLLFQSDVIYPQVGWPDNLEKYSDELATTRWRSDSVYPSVHMSLGGQHQGWGGTDQITVNLQNEGFEGVQLTDCSIRWRIVNDDKMHKLQPEAHMRWVRSMPWQDGYANFVLPKILDSGYTINVIFRLTTKDIENSGVDISKHCKSLDPKHCEHIASSIIYEVSAKIRTKSGSVMCGSITYFFPEDRGKRLSVCLR